MAQLSLFLFGSPRIKLNNVLIDIDRRKAVALLAYLAMTAETHSREHLAALLWPDFDHLRSRAALRRVLSSLNKAKLGPWLDISRHAIGLNPLATLWVDTTHFHRLVTEYLSSNETPCELYQSQLADAVKFYQGDFLSGFTLKDSSDFDEWQLFQAEALRQLQTKALAYLVRCHETHREFDDAISYARQWLTFDPLVENAHRQLMQLYFKNNQRSAALKQYRECVQILKQDLGVSPSIETTDLNKKIQSQLVQPTQTDLPSAAAEILYNFPAQSTPFIGRQTELAEIAARLENPDCRLLTLIGQGGMGKTRLSIQTAIDSQETFPHGIYFVPLAAVSSPEFMINAIADSLGLSLDGREAPRPQLLNYLKDKAFLLVIDNFEHLVNKVDVLADILTLAPQLKMLITSRERLNLHGEWIVGVTGMAYPQRAQPDKLESYNAVTLFLQSASRIHSGFSVTDNDIPYIVRICQLVEGMPLAIELAAAWIRVLSCQEIAQEIDRMTELQRSLDFLTTSLRDMPKRHQSLQAVFDHSWHLLKTKEQNIFKKLAVFRGGYTREAVAAVTGATLTQLSALVDKSLLTRTSSGRYQMHELLQQYALEKLRQAPQETEAVQNRHCDYYATFLCQREESLKGARQEEILAEISAEIENIRAAWRWAILKRNSYELGRTVLSLGRFYSMYSRFQEGYNSFGQALVALQDRADKMILKGQLLAYQGWFLLREGRYDRARILLKKSIAIFRGQDDKNELAVPLQFLGILASEVGDYTEARMLLQESLDIFREINNRWEVAWTLSHLGYCISKLEQGERAQARKLLQESLAIYQQLDGKQGISIVLSNLGYVSYRRGDLVEAKQLLQESLALRQEIGYPRGIAVTLNNLGHVAGASGNYESSTAHYHQSLEIAMGIGAIPLALDALGGLAIPLMYHNQTNLALRLLRLALYHPAGNKETRNRAARFMDELGEKFATQPIASPSTAFDYAREFETLAAAILE